MQQSPSLVNMNGVVHHAGQALAGEAMYAFSGRQSSFVESSVCTCLIPKSMSQSRDAPRGTRSCRVPRAL